MSLNEIDIQYIKSELIALEKDYNYGYTEYNTKLIKALKDLLANIDIDTIDNLNRQIKTLEKQNSYLADKYTKLAVFLGAHSPSGTLKGLIIRFYLRALFIVFGSISMGLVGLVIFVLITSILFGN